MYFIDRMLVGWLVGVLTVVLTGGCWSIGWSIGLLPGRRFVLRVEDRQRPRW